MDFVDLKFTINVSFHTMTLEKYQEFEKDLEEMQRDDKIDNQKLIDLLALDKRPFAVASIKSPKIDQNEHISNAEIDLIC
jgi:hypothetical protein